MSQNDSHEPVTVTDKRRIDPETGEIRSRARGAEEHEQATGPAPSGPAPEAARLEPRNGQMRRRPMSLPN